MSWGGRIILLLVRVVEGEVVCNNHGSEHRLQKSKLVRWHRGKNVNKKEQMDAVVPRAGVSSVDVHGRDTAGSCLHLRVELDYSAESLPTQSNL